MGMLKDKDRNQLTKAFGALTGRVRLLVFTQEVECEYCQLTRELVQEVASLSDRIAVEVLDLVKDDARAQELGVDKAPAVVVMGDRDYRIRFYGVPAGYEFTTLVEAILDVSRGTHGLAPGVVSELARVDQPVRLQVMITPT